MRIMIIQSEIEEAIAEKVLSQMSINDDMELKIDLSATRGDDGFTATIDVVARAEPAPKKATPARRGPGRPPKDAAASAAQAAAPAASAPVETAEVAEEAAQDSEAVEEQAVDTQEAEPAQEAAAPTGSIFGNLRKPTNEAAPAA